MKKKRPDLTGITSMIHLVAVLSVVCVGTMVLTLGVLALPALTSAFMIGKDVILRRFDVYDSLTKRFFRQLTEELRMLRYLPLQLIAVLQAVGIFACGKVGLGMIGYVLAASMAFFLTLMVYTVTYHVFCKPLPSMPEVLIAMFYKLQNLLAVWALMLLVSLLCSIKLLAAAMILGAIPILLAETAAFIGIVSFRKAGGKLTEAETADIGDALIEKL